MLGRVTIYAASDANSAEQQAVLTLVSTLARIYAPRPLPITVVSQPRGAQPPPALGMDRAVVVETGEPGLSVENPGRQTLIFGFPVTATNSRHRCRCLPLSCNHWRRWPRLASPKPGPTRFSAETRSRSAS